MRSLMIGATISILFSFNSHACEEAHTTQAIVNYVCDYSLVSDTQCKIWKEDMRQMNYNNKIIVDSFISWDRNLDLEEPPHIVAEHFTAN